MLCVAMLVMMAKRKDKTRSTVSLFFHNSDTRAHSAYNCGFSSVTLGHCHTQTMIVNLPFITKYSTDGSLTDAAALPEKAEPPFG